MPQNDGFFALLQSQIEQVLADIRAQREEIGDIKSEMVTKEDLREHKDTFSEKMEEVHEKLQCLEEEIETLVTRADDSEIKQEKINNFINNFKGGMKWLGGCLAATFFSALASWLSSNVFQHPTNSTTYNVPIGSGQSSPQLDNGAHHANIKVNFNK